MEGCIATTHWDACETCANNDENYGCLVREEIPLSLYLGDWILCGDYEKAIESEARSDIEGFMTLSYMQEASIRDINGNCRCPYCGRYRKRSDFPGQPAHIPFGRKDMRGRINVPPACRFCMEKEED